MSTTLHIPQIDNSLMRSLELLAEVEHTSVEEIVRRQLRKLGNAETPRSINRHNNKDAVITSLSGVWDENDAREFEEATAPFREIDEALWQ